MGSEPPLVGAGRMKCMGVWVAIPARDVTCCDSSRDVGAVLRDGFLPKIVKVTNQYPVCAGSSCFLFVGSVPAQDRRGVEAPRVHGLSKIVL